MKNNVKRIMALFLCIGCLFGVVSCGAKPDTDVPKDDDTPVEDIAPLPPEEKPEEITAEEAYRLIYDEIIKYMAVYAEKNITFLSVKDADSITNEMKYREVVEKIGKAHFQSVSLASSSYKLTREAMIYIVEDGTILFLYINSENEEIITRMQADELVSHMKANWEKALIVPTDPQMTYDQLYADMEKRKYMHISDRTDFVDVNTAKEIPIFDVSIPRNNSTVEEVLKKLGEPHFMQAEEVRPPHLSGGDRATFYIYILSDGTVLCFESGYNAKMIGFPLHYTVEEALDYYSRAMYY